MGRQEGLRPMINRVHIVPDYLSPGMAYDLGGNMTILQHLHCYSGSLYLLYLFRRLIGVEPLPDVDSYITGGALNVMRSCASPHRDLVPRS
jgi:hypothetical protein